MQDAVEAFLIAVADHVGATIPPKTDFDKYFVQIDHAITPRELPLKTKLLRLNKIRVMSKHEGVLPPHRECESLAHTVRDFFEQVSTEHLHVNFLTVTPIDLLMEGEVKDLLVQARLAHDAGNFHECVVNCRKALYMEIEHNYDISEFRHGTPKRYGILFGPHSRAPYYTRTQEYIDKNVRDATDFIVIDHDDLDRSLLNSRVDPTMFWNVWRLTPALWRCKSTKAWIIKRDLDLLCERALLENVDYVLNSTIEIVLGIHFKQRNVRSQQYLGYQVTLAREGVPVYRKADKTSAVVGLTPPGLTTMMADFDIDGLNDGDRYWSVVASVEAGFLGGYVLQSDLTFDT